jgi:hypothetical protein
MQIRKEHWDVIVGVATRSSAKLGNAFGVNFTLTPKSRPVTNFNFTVRIPAGLINPDLIIDLDSGELQSCRAAGVLACTSVLLLRDWMDVCDTLLKQAGCAAAQL